MLGDEAHARTYRREGRWCIERGLPASTTNISLTSAGESRKTWVSLRLSLRSLTSFFLFCVATRNKTCTQKFNDMLFFFFFCALCSSDVGCAGSEERRSLHGYSHHPLPYRFLLHARDRPRPIERYISLVINIYFSILPNQQRARSDFCLIFLRGQLWPCGKVHHAEVKEISGGREAPRHGRRRVHVRPCPLPPPRFVSARRASKCRRRCCGRRRQCDSGLSAVSALLQTSADISLVINIYFLFCRTNSVRDLIFV
jgi:hypothetical protein